MLDRQFGAFRRAMQRDKGPEVRAKEVKLDASMHNAWDSENYAWAVTWMLRAIEAANVKAKDVMVKTDSKVVRLNVRKSKTDQKGVGTWRTLRCCGLEECKRDCPFDLAIRALNDLKGATADTPLFPDSKGGPMSKIHMVTAWTKHIDEEMTGHSARRSGAMKYARQGMSVQAIQFLGRWKSSALLRPKSSASAKKARKEDNSPESPQKHLVDGPEKGPVCGIEIKGHLDETRGGPSVMGHPAGLMGNHLWLELCPTECQSGVDAKAKRPSKGATDCRVSATESKEQESGRQA